jgi:hypothetical protein
MAGSIFHPLPYHLTRYHISTRACETESQPAQSSGNSHRRDNISFSRLVGSAMRLEVLFDDGSLLARVMDSRGGETQPNQRCAGGEGC